MMQAFIDSSNLFAGNAPFLEELYDTYLAQPESVDPQWRAYFDQLSAGAQDVSHQQVMDGFVDLVKRRPQVVAAADSRQVAVSKLILAYRRLGARAAKLDPLGRSLMDRPEELSLAYWGLTEADLGVEFATDIAGLNKARLSDIVEAMEATYCGTVSMEAHHLADTREKEWLAERFESCRSRPNYNAEAKRHILERLTAAEVLETYLHNRYTGQKRFSLQGGDTMIPMLDRLLQHLGGLGVDETVIGMAHRGRLNVLVNTLGKVPADLFSEFEGKYNPDLLAGDVKYHMGFSSDISTPGGAMHLTLAFNPSHLEIACPVVIGSVRSRQERRGAESAKKVLPVLIHGDAAFAGQGVIMETLNLSQTRGYGTGGTIHLIVNNQIGFTTSDPRDVRSTAFCSDVAKMVEAPIIHVNADDPEAAVWACEVAADYRMSFGKDVVLDMVCYRRLGHNEQDEPMVTQPLMYKLIAMQQTTRKLYSDRLEQEGVLKPGEGDEFVNTFKQALDRGQHTNRTVLSNFKAPFVVDWGPYLNQQWKDEADTALPAAKLKKLGQQLATVPADISLHPRVKKIVEDRHLMALGKLPLDWGMAENLAYASLLAEHYHIRLSGQDSGRGTFFHRHAVLHDQNRRSWDSGYHIPLNHLGVEQGRFEVIDSVLSEEAVLAYEYGYTTSAPNRLVIWEAQFGDFANGAQVVIDQFISSGEVKWGRICSLVMMLPHGFEGQGPEHSSARLERYLQLCANTNMQVCVPTTPAQIFHLLRRQMTRTVRKPLIIMTPKSLLRHKEAISSLVELSQGRFETVLADRAEPKPASVKRVLVCSGKVFYDLDAYRQEQGINHTAVLRMEQIYPCPEARLAELLAAYPKAREVVWVQEEPRNQGAWYFLKHRIERSLKTGQQLHYVGRPSSASPAVGYASKHAKEQKALVEAAFGSLQKAV